MITRGRPSRLIAAPESYLSGLFDWRRLERGTPDQRRAFVALKSTAIMERLVRFTPVLAGTLPIDVHLPDSDLDIICRLRDARGFQEDMRGRFGGEDDFTCYTFGGERRAAVVARFRAAGFEFEIFARDEIVTRQPAVLHMIAEARLLAACGPVLHEKVRRLKASGLATEPAFARALGLRGDPYRRLLEIARWRPGEIQRLIGRRR